MIEKTKMVISLCSANLRLARCLCGEHIGKVARTSWATQKECHPERSEGSLERVAGVPVRAAHAPERQKGYIKKGGSQCPVMNLER